MNILKPNIAMTKSSQIKQLKAIGLDMDLFNKTMEEETNHRQLYSANELEEAVMNKDYLSILISPIDQIGITKERLMGAKQIPTNDPGLLRYFWKMNRIDVYSHYLCKLLIIHGRMELFPIIASRKYWAFPLCRELHRTPFCVLKGGLPRVLNGLLCVAVCTDDAELYKLLIENGMKGGMKYLYMLIHNKANKCVKVFIEHYGVSLDYFDSPLHSYILLILDEQGIPYTAENALYLLSISLHNASLAKLFIKNMLSLAPSETLPLKLAGLLVAIQHRYIDLLCMMKSAEGGAYIPSLLAIAKHPTDKKTIESFIHGTQASK